MNSYSFTPALIIRTPAFSYDQYDHSDDHMQQVLNDTQFRSAIALASRSLFSQLRLAAFTYARLNAKVRLSLKKYYNRMCFRATPFGLFSGISTAIWGKDGPITFKDAFQPKVMYSFEHIMSAAHKFRHALSHDLFTFRANDTVYIVGQHYRYLRYEDGADGKRKFFLHEIEITDLLTALLGYCRESRSKADLVQFIAAGAGAGSRQSEDYIDALVEQQIITYYQKDTIDKSYVSYAAQQFPASGLTPVLEWSEPVRCDEMQALYELLMSRPPQQQGRPEFYVNLNMPLASGEVSDSCQDHIKNGLYCISRLASRSTHQSLQSFKAAFRKRFDLQMIPLLVALDPETGINYEQLANIETPSALLQDITISPKTEKGTSVVNWSPAHALLLQKMQQSNGGPVELTIDDVEQLPVSAQSAVAPNSISAVFRPVDNGVYIESAGGVSGNGLVGRFTIFDQDIERHCTMVARQTEQANPEVVFAEINYFGDEHTANIDRRKPVWTYEIPVLTGSVMPVDQQIPLSDLHVRIAGDRIILWSARLQKVVIPMLSSAYNYTRGELAVFRFLCDMQHQEVSTDLTFSLSDFFPGLHYYPRVVCGGAILQLATWHIPEPRLAMVQHKRTPQEGLEALEKLVAEVKLPRMISVNDHDNQLVFDTTDKDDLGFLLAHIGSQSSLTIKEFPFVRSAPAEGSGAIGYLHQMVATMLHTNEVYKAVPQQYAAPHKPRKYMPGSKWLYYKIYCHPARANELLTDIIVPYTDGLRGKAILQQWFFIRYNDPNYHLRLRLQIEEQSTGITITQMNARLNELIEKGVISNFQIDVYEQELERYGADIIEDVEAWFCASTAALLPQLHIEPYELAATVFAHIHQVCHSFGMAVDDLVRLFGDLYASFSKEFDWSALEREQLKGKLREVKEHRLLPGQNPYPAGVCGRFDAACKSLYAVVSGHSPIRKEQLVADLVHMHLNRAFVTDARKQEMIVYYCLWKHYVSVKARSAG